MLDARDVAAPLLQPGRALLRLALACEQAPVLDDRLVRRAVERDEPVLQQHRAIAEALDRRSVVRDEDDRAAALLELEDLAEALPLERLVADGEHLVEQQDVGLDVRGDREAEAHVHPRRVRAHRQVDEVLEPGEGDDLVELLADRRAAEAVDRAVEVDVLAAGQVGMEARAELEQRADPPADGDAAGRRLDDSREQAQQRRLAGPVAADEADRAAGLDRERDVAQRDDVGAAHAAARDEQILERAVLARIDAEAARGVLDDDLSGPHAGDGTPSARRTMPASVADERGVGVRHLDPVDAHPELRGALLRLDVDVPADLQMVGDEADRADEHVVDALCMQRGEVVEDVGPEPRLAGRRLALERERPSLAEACGLGDEASGLEQLIFVGIAHGENAFRAASGQ